MESKLKSEQLTVTSRRTDATTTAVMFSVVLAVLSSNFGLTESAIETSNGNNLEYKEYWYKTEQLCPDLQEAVSGKDIDTANYPYKSVFRFMDHLQSVSEPYADLPCILEANGPRKLVSTALIEAIHVDSRPWNYTGADTCEEHIKLRLPEPSFLKRSNVPKIICRIPKSRTGLKDATGSLYHPYVWQFQKGKLGLSFSSFNLSHLVQRQLNSLREVNLTDSDDFQNENNKSTESSANKTNYWLARDGKGRQFVQIVFTTLFGGMCSVRVQQYLVDPHKTLCGDTHELSPFRLCGLYNCAEKEKILRALGFWTHRRVHDQLDNLLQSSLPRWRREEPFGNYLEILVSTLRALIMPLLFLSVFYITRKLRLKLGGSSASHVEAEDRRRNVMRQRQAVQCYLRSLMREGNNNNSSGSSDSSSGSADRMLRPSLILNHVVYDIPVGSGAPEYSMYEDLPPAYDSIVQPPSYEVATQVKQASSACPVILEGVVPASDNTIPSPWAIPRVGGRNGRIGLSVPTDAETTVTPAATSSASHPIRNSRPSILDEDVVFQTTSETRPFTINSITDMASTSTTSTVGTRTLNNSPI